MADFDQAAAVPFRLSRFGIEVLLVTSSGSGRWTVPKGGIKKGHDAQKTARLETLEEAGVLGELVGPPLGAFSYKKSGRRQRVRVYALRVERVLDRWQEEDRRRRVWVPIAEAPGLVGRRPIAELLVRLRHRILSATGQLTRLAA